MGWTSNPATDHDGDGCRDAVEDTDDDNDGKLDGADSCPAGELAWASNGTTDLDNDGCRDAGEDTDDDNDIVTDAVDNCPLISNPDQAVTDQDGLGDACETTGVEDHGPARVSWSGTDDARRRVSAGLYVARLTVAGRSVDVQVIRR